MNLQMPHTYHSVQHSIMTFHLFIYITWQLKVTRIKIECLFLKICIKTCLDDIHIKLTKQEIY